MPIFKAKKLILAGDPKQLPPTIHSLPASKSLASRHQGTSSTSSHVNLSRTTNPVPHERVDSEGDSDEERDFVETASGDCAPNAPGPTSKMASSSHYRGLTPPRTLELTMFERLEKMYGPGIKCMLTVQYRYVTAPR
jgi:DNA polymerase alpha-associated DNA helicase A